MISFVMRARDEEKVIAASIESILQLTIPLELIIVCDRCEDGTEGIVDGYARLHKEIRKVVRNKPYARAGLETLITPMASEFSLPTAMNDCFSEARYRWRFHVGADFQITLPLREWLEEPSTLAPALPLAYRIAAVTPEDGLRNAELYLSNCLERFEKHIFWDVPVFTSGVVEAQAPEECVIRHMSTLAQVKSYWHERPWWMLKRWEPHRLYSFTSDGFDLAKRYQVATQILGPEPVGCARGSNPDCNPYLARVYEKRKELEDSGIEFFR